MLSSLPVATTVHALDGRMIFANDAACRLHRATADELRAWFERPAHSFSVDEDGAPLPAATHPLERVIDGAQAIDGVVVGWRPRPDAPNRWLRWSVAPLLDAEGRVCAVIASTVDVTELREEASRLRAALAAEVADRDAVVNALPEGVAVHAADGRIVYANQALARMFGAPREALLGARKMPRDWVVTDASGNALLPSEYPVAITLRTGESCHGVVLGLERPGATRRWLRVSSDCIAGPGDRSRGVVVSHIDVTAQRDARRALEAANERFAAFAGASPGVLYQLHYARSGEASLRFVAGRVEELFGLGRAELLEDLHSIWARVHREDLGAIHEAIARALEARAHPAIVARVRNAGDGYRWLRATGEVERSEGGWTFTGFVVDAHEERLLAEQLRKSQRREAMGDLTAGIAHNFNNVLAVVLPSLEGLRELATLATTEAMPLIEDAIEASRRASDLVRQLMHVVRGDLAATNEHVELTSIVREVESLCRRSFDRGIEFDVRLPAGQLAYSRGRASALHQLLLNLCINARDALDGRNDRRIVIELAPAERSERGRPIPGWALSVRDNGVGMDRATQQRIGEPFFTTKGPGRGTGLGLASVLGTLRDVDGELEVESELGVGTAFIVKLPASAPPGAEVTHPGASSTEWRGHVLLVEDEPLVRRALARTLTRMRATVTEVEDGASALARLERERSKFDVVLLDLSMPGLDGRKVLQTIHARWSSLPVIVCTGDAGEMESLRDAADVLHKPVAIDALRRSLSALDVRRFGNIR